MPNYKNPQSGTFDFSACREHDDDSSDNPKEKSFNLHLQQAIFLAQTFLHTSSITHQVVPSKRLYSEVF